MTITNTVVRVATVQSFYKRKDRFWFEKLARNKSDQEVVEFFVSNFITCTDPSKLWIGEMIEREKVDMFHGRNERSLYHTSSKKRLKNFLTETLTLCLPLMVQGIHKF